MDASETGGMSEPDRHPSIPMPDPLVGDPGRQACDSIRGYLYQIWISVHAWLELDGDAILYLEGAEDIDLLNGDEAETIQVKDQTANVTLRSPAITQAISSYWFLREQNPNRLMRFRFLATTSAGVEQGIPFGAGVKGLEFWERSCRDSDAARALITFLKDLASLPQSLREYLSSVDVAKIQEEVLRPITWELGVCDATYVAAAVDRKLVVLGENYGVFPDHAKSVAPLLLETALNNAAASERHALTRDQLLECFEEATTERVPCKEIQRLRLLREKLAVGLMPPSGTSESMEFASGTRIQRSIPDLPRNLLYRDQLVADCRQVLDQTGFMVLTGSVGMGKTTLAKLVAKEGGAWVWANMSAVPAEVVVFVLNSLGQLVDADASVTDILVDDIDMSPDTCRLYESALGGLMLTMHARGGRVIATSQRAPSQRFQAALNMQPESVLNIPALTEEEIVAVFAALGFPRGEEECKQQARIAWFQTSGHPQLVQAAAKSLVDSGWPPPCLDSLINQPEAISQEKSEARQILVGAISDEQRTLTYWLGLVGMFRRDHAVEIGTKIGAANPGDHFDALVGPWIEPISDAYFRVTPLIGAAANDVYAQDELREIHRGIAESLFLCRNLSQYEANSIFMHALVGKHEHLLLLSVSGITTAEHSVKTLLLRELSWFLAVDPEPGHLIFPENVHVNAALRLLQFRIAAEVDPSKAEGIAQRWDSELSECEPREMYLLERFMYVLHLLVLCQAPISPKRLIACFAEMEELQLQMPELADRMASVKLPPIGDSPAADATDSATLFFGFTLSRCTGSDFLLELAQELAHVPDDLRRRMLSTFSDSVSAATMLIDRAWLAESKKKAPDWDDCLSILKQVRGLAKDMDAINLVYAATRGIAIILDEYIETPDVALTDIDAIESECGPSPITQDERATILYHQKDWQGALTIWREMLENWDQVPVDYDLSILTCRKAGICAAKVGDWALAANLFEQGHEKAKDTELRWVTVGLLGDAAHAHYKSRKYGALVQALRRSIELLDQLPDAEHDFSTFSLGKRLGSVLVWIKNELTQSRSKHHGEPYAGMCSDPEPNEKLRESPRTLSEACWVILAEIEYKLSAGRGIYDSVCSQLDACEFATVQVLLRSLRLSFSARHGEYEEVPHDAFICARTMTASRSALGSLNAPEIMVNRETLARGITAEEIEFVEHTLLAVLVCAAARGQHSEALQKWTDAIEATPEITPLEEFIRSTEEILALREEDARERMRDAGAGWIVQTLGALRLTLDDNTSSEDMFQAHYVLLECVRVSSVKGEAADWLADLVTRNWIHLIQFKALLRSPMLTVPAIEAACQSQAKGLSKIAGILLAVAGAISMQIPTGIISDLEELSRS